jgi:hypothetical protein
MLASTTRALYIEFRIEINKVANGMWASSSKAFCIGLKLPSHNEGHSQVVNQKLIRKSRRHSLILMPQMRISLIFAKGFRTFRPAVLILLRAFAHLGRKY